MMFVVRRLQELARKEDTPLFMRLIDLTKPMTPPIALCCGLFWLALVFHREFSPHFANSTTARGHACG